MNVLIIDFSVGIYDKWKNEGELDNILALIKVYRAKGYNLKSIASALNISTTTLSKYKKTYSDIANALKMGKDDADTQVASKLFKNACGYEYIEQTVVKYKDSYELVDIKKVRHPDTNAQIFWLSRKDKYFQEELEEVEFEDISRIDIMVGFENE